MKSVMHILFLSCQKATELIEKKINLGELSRTEFTLLKAHKLMCKFCTNYERQSLLIEKGIAAKNKYEFTEQELEELKQSIIKKLENYRE